MDDVAVAAELLLLHHHPNHVCWHGCCQCLLVQLLLMLIVTVTVMLIGTVAVWIVDTSVASDVDDDNDRSEATIM